MEHQFSKEQRHDMYKQAYQDILSGKCDFICESIKDQIDGELKFKRIPPLFEELDMFNPDRYAWWDLNEDGNNSRLNALAFCIEMTA